MTRRRRRWPLRGPVRGLPKRYNERVQDPSAPPARYFPVSPQPLRMQAGLRRFGIDIGNGAADTRFFQIDRERPRYLANKARLRRLGAAAGLRHALLDTDAAHAQAHRAVLTWIEQTRRSEGVPAIAAETNSSDPYDALFVDLQEDAAVLYRDPSGVDRAILVSVFAPSGWRPERIVGASFAQIHAPVPDFADERRAASSMVSAMVERGPYVRFVWTISADDHLDHHPEHGARHPFDAAGTGWLRVERQVTVPFPEQQASLFLIRTYLYPFEQLDPQQRETLALALERMPASIRRYKGIDEAVPQVTSRLRKG